MAPTDGQRATTLSDVARRAGVSIATASKALNGRGDVAPATRKRVLAAADELTFTPNAAARSLLAGRTGTVGLLTSDLEGRFMIPILSGAEDAFGAGQVNVFLCDARGDAIREQHHLRALLSRRVDGIIVVGRQTDPRPSLGQEIPVPVVYAYSPSDDSRDLSLTPDNYSGGRLAIEHLLSCGRTRIAHITGDPTYAAAQDRLAGARAALGAAGLDFVAEPMFAAWTEHWGRDAAAMLLERHPDVDAVFCGSDQIARGVLDTARDLGRDVPGDLAVIGYDNWELLAGNARPPLTTIDANLQQLGRQAAQRIFDAIDGADIGSGTHQLPVKLVIRGSTIAHR
ncbi:LacI family DNA-binding transcriptional regulator [Microbacterium sp. NE2HP2]|uniref:LacI family DNA-binding transcriptional regulator n=1 Tax=Microbacterium TaxID=33882 RepID=UPI0022AF75F5|nr:MULTISPECIES: LacI family DNA-binding transcriptional regulator [Microbacterium]MCZ4068367.1 LacI family DNA-binding transcriptional regulator [Microbacterium sp. H37-C3]MDD7945807.1 LacI family DNA-binding transcriptional regulator [Microbacterium plantarum]WHE35745.1 LacI family DNA-binding transcriptional regulator [Microbacterium sp. BDGP8]WRK16909.1 LacI family DNA-binding transcriptional regulator [Microbacterium plantarum]